MKNNLAILLKIKSPITFFDAHYEVDECVTGRHLAKDLNLDYREFLFQLKNKSYDQWLTYSDVLSCYDRHGNKIEEGNKIRLESDVDDAAFDGVLDVFRENDQLCIELYGLKVYLYNYSADTPTDSNYLYKTEIIVQDASTLSLIGEKDAVKEKGEVITVLKKLNILDDEGQLTEKYQTSNEENIKKKGWWQNEK